MELNVGIPSNTFKGMRIIANIIKNTGYGKEIKFSAQKLEENVR